jgi:hypothetical protein
MHFGTKNYLKSNRNHTAKQTLSLKIFQSIKKPPKIKNQDSGIGIHVVLVLKKMCPNNITEADISLNFLQEES